MGEGIKYVNQFCSANGRGIFFSPKSENLVREPLGTQISEAEVTSFLGWSS